MYADHAWHCSVIASLANMLFNTSSCARCQSSCSAPSRRLCLGTLLHSARCSHRQFICQAWWWNQSGMGGGWCGDGGGWCDPGWQGTVWGWAGLASTQCLACLNRASYLLAQPETAPTARFCPGGRSLGVLQSHETILLENTPNMHPFASHANPWVLGTMLFYGFAVRPAIGFSDRAWPSKPYPRDHIRRPSVRSHLLWAMGTRSGQCCSDVLASLFPYSEIYVLSACRWRLPPLRLMFVVCLAASACHSACRH
jgi:hypothetical protein